MKQIGEPWTFMMFGMKNGPPTHQMVVNRAFRDYLNKCTKCFLNEFIIHNMDIHLNKLRLCFYKCREFGIDLSPNKYAFMVFSKMILDL